MFRHNLFMQFDQDPIKDVGHSLRSSKSSEKANLSRRKSQEQLDSAKLFEATSSSKLDSQR